MLQLIPNIVTCVCFFLLFFIALTNPTRVNIIANRWFGVFLYAAGSIFLNNIIYSVNANEQYYRLIAFNELSRLALAPALYLSVLHYTSANKILRKTEWLHFLPFSLFFIYMLPVVIVGHFSFFASVPPFISKVFIVVARLQLPIYWALSYYQLNRHQKNIQLINADTAPVNLGWLKLLLGGIALIILLAYIQVSFKPQWLPVYLAYGYLAATLVICYCLLAQKEIYPFETPVLIEVEQVINPSKFKEDKKRLINQQTEALKNKLEHLMQTGKVYLDNELSLPQLAELMDATTHELSYVLNEGLGVNFFQYINKHRVEEAKQLMLSNEYKHLNLLGIAYRAGFNSKTTFNTTFKKDTGLSPTEFIKQARLHTQPGISLQ